MKTKNLKKFSFLGMLIFIFLFSSHANTNSNSTEKKEKKTISVYKKAYITHPLFVFAMHNGEQYAFINSNKHGSTSKVQAKNLSTPCIEKQNIASKENTSNSEKIIEENTLKKYNETELQIEDWMISNFNSPLHVEKELQFEKWMTNENHWKLKE